DLRGEALERGRAERERAEEFGVAVTRNHLRRERIGLEPKALAGNPLHLRLDLRVRSDGPRQLADAIPLQRRGEACPRAVALEGPAGELPAEGRRLGVDAVGPAYADRVPVLP